jgi:alkylation response protein AidB-like acyl-CoA dehydrogenase
VYQPPLADMQFVLDRVAGLPAVARLPGFDEAVHEMAPAVLAEAGRLASEVLAPLNAVGDRHGAVLENGVVRTAPGFREAYRRYAEGGWMGLVFPEEHGGQNLPWLLNTAVAEMWNAANLTFQLCPLLTQAGIEALVHHGTPEQKRLYLPRLVSGEWTGAMCLTEPQAGSDVGALRTRAEPESGGRYRIRGQKIYITFGEHDLTPNIVHMVLARLPGAPEGTKGISLFLVPKFLVTTTAAWAPATTSAA